MTKKIAVITYPGTNCDFDVVYALKIAGAKPLRIWYKEISSLNDADAVIIPGGFSYGDYVRAGAIAARTKITEKVREMADNGMPILGICNGFQVLVESKILPGALTVNKRARFVCKWVYLKVIRNDTPFTLLFEEGEVIRMPIAHAEGRYVPDEKFSTDLVVLQYSDEKGEITEDCNPNGSYLNIAGISNKDRNVLGLMPHPERASEKILGGDDGLRMFKSLLEFLKR